jgi:hypothetical protein
MGCERDGCVIWAFGTILGLGGKCLRESGGGSHEVVICGERGECGAGEWGVMRSDV